MMWGKVKRSSQEKNVHHRIKIQSSMRTDIDVAEKYGINKSLVSKWKKEANKTQ